MHNTGQTGGTADADIDAPEAWDIETDANEIVVAVIDSGVDYNHPDLAANMWTDANGCYGYDFVNDDNNPMDDAGHGTHCAGTIGAVGNNNEGVVGVCWDVQIMALKFLDSTGSGYTDDAIDAIEYAVDNGAEVLSNSWGGAGYSQGLKDAIEAADANGLLFVAAAGNDSTNNDDTPHYPSSYDCANVIAVMSTDHDDQMSGFSNYGPTSVDLGAPGTTILSCKLGGGYTYKNGTSMATPHVAGACALVWAEHPTKSYLEVKETVMWTPDRLDDLDAKCVTSGRLNLYRALADKKVTNVTQSKWYDTIQDALDEANDLDIIRARPATYYETIDFNGVSCTLTSIDPNDPCVVAATIIDANSTGGFEIVVTFNSSEDANAVLTGFTITRGTSGVYCSQASPVITNCVITANSSSRYAGGIYCSAGSPKITKCVIKDNDAQLGAGMYNRGNPTLIDCTFTDNSATHYGGAISNSTDGNLTASNCIFTGNTAGYDGGAIDSYQSDLVLTDCIFHDNEATSSGGGAMLSNSCTLDLTNCVFSNNSAGSLGGGAMYNHALTSTLTNCTFSKNSTTSDGGAMKNTGTNDQTVVNCIYWDDSASGSGDEIYNASSSSEPNFSYCDIEGCGGSGPGWDPNLGSDDGNNIDADPCFVDSNDPNGADDIWATGDDGLALGFGSPCIDAADNDAVDLAGDIAGNFRKRDDPCTTDTGNGTPPIVDMGAYEHLANATIYVDLNATGGLYNGLSWGTAFKTLQHAIDYTIGGDQIRVAQGTYTLTSTIEVAKEVDIYGGYDADTGQRDTKNNLTIVDGNDTVRCFYVSADCTVDGFTITDGNAWNPDTQPWTDDAGGGMFNYLCHPNINDCNFYQNRAYSYGGAIANYQANPTITDCNFVDNTVEQYGGGTYNRYGDPTLTNCTFSGNIAGKGGGGVYNSFGNPTLTNCTFIGNYTEQYHGGGMRNSASNPNVSNCTFSGNTAAVNGGGMYNIYSDPNVTECNFSNNTANNGGGMSNYYSVPLVTNCTFTNNSADDGGGMHNEECTFTVDDCTFSENTAAESGGGMGNDDSLGTLTSCVFSDNNSVGDGGGMYNDDSTVIVDDCVFAENTALYDGGGMYNEDIDSTSKITSCVFWKNSADDDGGGMANDESEPAVINCTFFENEADTDGGAIYNLDSDPTIVNCIFWQNTAGSGDDDIENDGTSDPHEHDNFDDDPDFLDESDPNGADNVWRTCDDGLNLKSTSDCIDEGDSDDAEEDYDDLDIKGSDRIINGDVDMGAYEYDSGC